MKAFKNNQRAFVNCERIANAWKNTKRHRWTCRTYV